MIKNLPKMPYSRRRDVACAIIMLLIFVIGPGLLERC